MLARCQSGQNRSRNATSGWEFTPIEDAGGINIYAFVGNLPVSKVDRLGLDLLNPPAPNDRMKLLLWKASGTVRESMFGNLSKMQELIEELLVSYDEHWVVVNVLLDESQDNPDYNWGSDTITLIDPNDESAAIHEMIHMYNDKSNADFQGEFWATEDEGMAYGAQKIYTLVGEAHRFDPQDYASMSPEIVRKRLTREWKAMWMDRYLGGSALNGNDNFLGKPWEISFWNHTTFPITVNHFSKLQDKLHARFSCEEASRIVNSMPLALESCVRVSCEKGKPYFSAPDGFFVVPVQVDIHPSLR